ncbi:MAG: sterol desaturase family protein [Gemmataceae bacterium]
MQYQTLVLSLVGFIVVFLFSSFVEYVVHRLMHKRILLGQIHIDHHRDGNGQGVVKEFRDYFVPTAPAMVGGFLIIWLAFDQIWIGAACALGGLTYCIFAAYAHQVQHEYPELACWMRRPVHHVHHVHKMWHHNFGIGLDIWDRLLFTYKVVEWKPERPVRLKRFFQIKWV